MNNFFRDYAKRLTVILESMDYDSIDKIIEALEETLKRGSKVYVVGNGGSAATASHIANDLGSGLRRRGIINLDITSLTDNLSVITAISNDIGYENIFYMQLEGLLKKDDLLISISCSGNSPNILKVTRYAKDIGTKVIGMTGFSGGELKELSDIVFHIDTPSGEYGIVEDAHMILDHMIYSYYIDKGSIDA
jgi:D-sedoheptulose 7-phosphate isomerase